MSTYTHQVEGLSITGNTEFGGVYLAVKYEGPSDQGTSENNSMDLFTFKLFLISKHSPYLMLTSRRRSEGLTSEILVTQSVGR